MFPLISGCTPMHALTFKLHTVIETKLEGQVLGKSVAGGEDGQNCLGFIDIPSKNFYRALQVFSGHRNYAAYRTQRAFQGEPHGI